METNLLTIQGMRLSEALLQLPRENKQFANFFQRVRLKRENKLVGYHRVTLVQSLWNLSMAVINLLKGLKLNIHGTSILWYRSYTIHLKVT